MLRVRDDDARAFEDLVTRYQDRLVRVLEHLGPRRDMAEDLAQEVFMRVFRARKRYEPGAKFSTWLFTIANNVAHNARRSLMRRNEFGSRDPAKSNGDSSVENLATIALAPSGVMPTRRLEGVERAEMVRAAIQSLNDRQRTALLLNRFEEMSHEEIAQAMGMTAKGVKSLLSRARVNLRDVLAPYLDEGTPPGAPSESNEDERTGINIHQCKPPFIDLSNWLNRIKCPHGPQRYS